MDQRTRRSTEGLAIFQGSGWRKFGEEDFWIDLAEIVGGPFGGEENDFVAVVVEGDA